MAEEKDRAWLMAGYLLDNAVQLYGFPI